MIVVSADMVMHDTSFNHYFVVSKFIMKTLTFLSFGLEWYTMPKDINHIIYLFNALAELLNNEVSTLVIHNNDTNKITIAIFKKLIAKLNNI